MTPERLAALEAERQRADADADDAPSTRPTRPPPAAASPAPRGRTPHESHLDPLWRIETTLVAAAELATTAERQHHASTAARSAG